MTEKPNLQRFARDPLAFIDALVIPSAHGPRPFGDVMANFQRERFAAIVPAMLAIARGRKPDVGRFWWEATKGGSKDSDLACVLLWLLCFVPRPLTIQMGAADADQADETRKAARDVVRLNTWLSAAIDVQAKAIIGTRTDSRADILTADAASSHGARPDVLVINELSHITDRAFAETLMDNAAKVPNGLVIIATNAGLNPSWQLDWRCNAIESSRWHVHIFDQPAPWLDPAELDEAQRRNSANRFARLWRGQWVGESCGALTNDEISRAVALAGPLREPERGWSYVGGLDLGITKDASALCVIGRHDGYVERIPIRRPRQPSILAAMIDLGMIAAATDDADYEEVLIPGTGNLKLVSVLIWHAGANRRVEIGDIERAILTCHQRFNLQALAFDPWQALQLSERVRSHGVPTVETYFTADNLRRMAAATLEAFNEHRVAIYPHDELIADLKAMRCVERSGGSFRLEWPRTSQGHHDAGQAFALALHAAALASAGTAYEVAGELVCWPG